MSDGPTSLDAPSAPDVILSSDAVAKPDASDASVVPTTCAEANGKTGCCEGDTVYYCNPSLSSKTCTGGEVCGWESSKSYYDCVSPPAGADPSGKNPIACK
jgi:hypothetical protein